MALPVVIVRHGEKYSSLYTKLIKNTVPNVICLGDDIPFKYKWKGWHAKFELFSPEFPKPCFYMDLDTYVLKDINEFLIETDQLILIRDFYSPNRSNSGLMNIPRDTSHIWEHILKHDGKSPDGDYLSIIPHKKMQDLYPGKIQSYKCGEFYNSDRGRMWWANQKEKPDCSIMCFHGKPRPHETQGWAKEFWDRWT